MPRSLYPLRSRSRHPPYIIHNTSYIHPRYLPRHTSPLRPLSRRRRAYLPPHGIIPRRSPPRALARISRPARHIRHAHPIQRTIDNPNAYHTLFNQLSPLSTLNSPLSPTPTNPLSHQVHRFYSLSPNKVLSTFAVCVITCIVLVFYLYHLLSPFHSTSLWLGPSLIPIGLYKFIYGLYNFT